MHGDRARVVDGVGARLNRASEVATCPTARGGARPGTIIRRKQVIDDDLVLTEEPVIGEMMSDLATSKTTP